MTAKRLKLTLACCLATILITWFAAGPWDFLSKASGISVKAGAIITFFGYFGFMTIISLAAVGVLKSGGKNYSVLRGIASAIILIGLLGQSSAAPVSTMSVLLFLSIWDFYHPNPKKLVVLSKNEKIRQFIILGIGIILGLCIVALWPNNGLIETNYAWDPIMKPWLKWTFKIICVALTFYVLGSTPRGLLKQGTWMYLSLLLIAALAFLGFQWTEPSFGSVFGNAYLSTTLVIKMALKAPKSNRFLGRATAP